MRKETLDWFENIDAAVFLGDDFLNPASLKEAQNYIDRWNREFAKTRKNNYYNEKFKYIYNKQSATYEYGTQNLGIGIFKDEKNGTLLKDGTKESWFANVVIDNIYGVGPYKTFKEVKQAAEEEFARLKEELR